MSFEADLKAHLQGASAISDIVGDRIFPLIVAQGESRPAVSYQVISIDQVSSLAGRADTLRNIRVQIDLWSASHSTLLQLDAAVRARMDTAASTFRAVLAVGGLDDYEPQTKLYRRVLEFSCWFTET